MLTHIIHYTAADCISLHGLHCASFRDAVSFRLRLPRRAHAPSAQRQNRQVLRENGTLILAGNACIRPKTFVSLTKPSQFRVIARPRCGRGNLKVEGMESRGEAREQKMTKFPEAVPNFTAKPYSLARWANFTCAVSFTCSKSKFHCAARTVPCRVGRKERSPQIDFAATVWSFY